MAKVENRVDVVTVGAGWTATILAMILTKAGMKVVSLEAGPSRFANPEFAHDHDPLRYAVRKEMMWDISREGWTWRPNPAATALPMRKFGSFHPGRGIGGAAVHWSGMWWRFYDTDFRYRSHHLERYGESKLPDGNRIQDWPLTYTDLEPYYTRADIDIGASGKAGNLNGEIVPGGNPFEDPRSQEYPLPPLAVTLPSDMFEKACRDLGYHPFPQPAGITSQAYQDPLGNYRSGCLYCGYCTRYGCEVDAKSSPVTTHLPAAMKTGRYEIRTYVKVKQVNTDRDGLASGVTYVDANGEEHEQPADIVVLSAYTLSNVKLLLVSKSEQHPDGLGNDRGMVGKNYTYQLWETPVKGIFEGHRFNLFAGNTSTINCIHDFNADNFDHADLDFVGGASIFSATGEVDPVTSPADLPLDNDMAWGKSWKAELRKNWDAVVPITIQGESLPYEDQFLDLDPNYRDNFGSPLLRITFDWHQNDKRLYAFMADKCKQIMERMGADQVHATSDLEDYEIHKYQSTHCTGGAIMGSGPGNSVTNSYGQVWDAPNVFVTGAALYPQNAGANPTGTLVALAYRTGDAIRDRYRKHTRALMD
ncbi:MAG TPA: GMC family oxidoreductase [Dehalococcoidia bacterium]|nr:GMC family oxidoreductase [Dehalococcoidia bacterium]